MDSTTNKILDELQRAFELFGSSNLAKILDAENREDLSSLYKKIRSYNQKIEVETYVDNSDEDSGEEGSSFKIRPTYRIYIKGIAIDPGNLERIELAEEYSIKKQKMLYSIIIYKKFVNPEEYCFDIKFEDEEERDYWYDILNVKLRAANIMIL